MIYLDAAAVVKLAHAEAETEKLQSWLTQRTDVPRVSSALIEVEVPRALRRWAPQALARVPDLFARIYRENIRPEIRSLAASLDDPTLRSLDAIHLATALDHAGELEAFVTYDKRLLAAARAQGLSVASPGA